MRRMMLRVISLLSSVCYSVLVALYTTFVQYLCGWLLSVVVAAGDGGGGVQVQ